MKSLIRFVLLVLVIGAVYLGFNSGNLPQTGFDPQILGATITNIFPDQASDSAQVAVPGVVAGIYTKASDYFHSFAQNTKIPTRFTGLPEEVIVEDVVNTFSKEVKSLPQAQVKRIKSEICQDVITEAVATVSAHP
jgi:hypothetical protein